MKTAATLTRHEDADADAIVLRPARRTDEDALRRLAALDDSRPLRGEILVAERDGAIAAAHEMRTGRSIADPFQLTGELVSLLEARAALLHRAIAVRRGPSLARRLLGATT